MEDDEKKRLIKEAIENGQFTRCPDGHAEGAGEMESWSRRRSRGLSGSGWGTQEDREQQARYRKVRRKSKAKRGGGKAKRTARYKARHVPLPS